MKMIGLFKELELGDKSLASIFDYRGLMYPEFKDEVLAYLKKGVTTMFFMQAVKDPLSKKDFRISGGSSLVSDGYWIWREDLAYFVEKYNIGLPDKFINDVISREGIASFDEDQICSQSKEIFDTYNNILLGDLSLLEY